ncbi:MAG: hypothetical protein QF372_02030 [Candidatus Poseidoniia archaeon]|jgi:hypothetical protein|nr:hypothetical protein [Candidatus Poseidoniia archaeon]HJO28039.1 hypothetical protein [Candidatus Poseidoniia archaeon]
MPETGQSEWNAQALVAAGAVLLLLTALWLGVYAPGQKKLSDDFETTYEYGGELKVLDIPQFQTMQDADNDGCSCTVYSNAIARHVLVAESGQSSDDETFFNENFSVFANDKTVDQDKDGLSDSYLFTLKDGNSWLDRVTYESRGEGSEADDYGYSTWNPNHPPTGDENFQFPNPFVGTHTNTYVYQPGGDTEIDGVSAYIYVADETATPIPYMPGPKNPLYGLLALGASFHISYHETVTIDATHGTALDREFDITVYADFPDFYAVEGGLLHLTDGVHFPSTTAYEGVLFDTEQGELDVSATKTTAVIGAMSNDTHLLLNIGFDVSTEIVIGMNNGTPVTATYQLNAEGELVPETNVYVDRSTHQVGSDATGYVDTFPHINTNVSAPGFFANPFDSNYINMYTPAMVPELDADGNETGNVTADINAYGAHHFTGVPFNPLTGNTTVLDYGMLYIYGDVRTADPLTGIPASTNQTDAPLPAEDMYNFIDPVNTTGYMVEMWNTSLYMEYQEDIWFDPLTGTMFNQHYNATVYATALPTGMPAPYPPVVYNLAVKKIDVQYAGNDSARADAYMTAIGQKTFAMYYSGKSIPVMDLLGGFTTDEQAAGVESAEERLSGLKLLDTYVPGLLIVLALGCLIGGFYLYYQEGEGGGGVAAPPAPEPEADDGGGDDTGDSADDDSGGDDADDGGDSDD